MDSSPEALLALSDDEFVELVNNIIRRKADNYKGKHTPEFLARAYKSLQAPEVAPRWYMVLARTAKSVDGQLAAREADFTSHRANLRAELTEAQLALKEAQESGQTPLSPYRRAVADAHIAIQDLTKEYGRQRGSTLRFKSGLDTNLIEARHAYEMTLHGMMSSIAAKERDHALQRVRELEEAIRRHRDNLDADDGSSIDEELWSVVDTMS